MTGMLQSGYVTGRVCYRTGMLQDGYVTVWVCKWSGMLQDRYVNVNVNAMQLCMCMNGLWVRVLYQGA